MGICLTIDETDEEFLDVGGLGGMRDDDEGKERCRWLEFVVVVCCF